METATIHRRGPQGVEQDSFTEQDRTESSSSLSPIISHATLEELVNTPSSEVRPPETPFSAYLLPHQYLVFIFPITLAFGSMFGYLGGDKPSYFSNKRNILNVLFVKNGWGWTSLVFLVYLAVVFGKALIEQDADPQQRPQGSTTTGGGSSEGASSSQSSQSIVGTNVPARGTAARARAPLDVVVRAVTRWGLATLYWWLISQWFFGPGLFDRFFVLTGGQCNIDGHYSQYHCRRMGGTWAGGIDISGHMFLLTHACLFLMEELSVFMNVPEAWSALQHRPTAKYAVWSVVGLCGLWWWMLLMTSVYFHGMGEKLSGLFVGMLFWLGSYVTTYKMISLMPDQVVVL